MYSVEPHQVHTPPYLGLAVCSAISADALTQLSTTLTPPTTIIFVEPEIFFRFIHCCKVRAVKSDLFLL